MRALNYNLDIERRSRWGRIIAELTGRISERLERPVREINANVTQALRTPREGAEYRVRGDQALGAPAWGLDPERHGYRFRPLTDAERDRIRGESQWWSGAALEPPGRVQPQAPSFGGGALGYEPDSWFGRHYGIIEADW